jgi:hypothetical protein
MYMQIYAYIYTCTYLYVYADICIHIYTYKMFQQKTSKLPVWKRHLPRAARLPTIQKS